MQHAWQKTIRGLATSRAGCVPGIRASCRPCTLRGPLVTKSPPTYVREGCWSSCALHTKRVDMKPTGGGRAEHEQKEKAGTGDHAISSTEIVRHAKTRCGQGRTRPSEFAGPENLHLAISVPKAHQTYRRVTGFYSSTYAAYHVNHLVPWLRARKNGFVLAQGPRRVR